MIDNDINSILACPHCHSNLAVNKYEAVCQNCGRAFEKTANDQFDFRLQGSEQRNIELPIGEYEGITDSNIRPIDRGKSRNPAKELPDRISPRLFDQLPYVGSEEPYLLDLGCGSDTLQSAVEEKGYSWVGIDIDSEEAMFLADAHSLPFKSNSFSATISLRVLEHLKQPNIALAEVARVTEKDGVFLGNVAFIEPFHGNSFFHHSPTGLLSVLNTAGFDTKRIGSDGHGFLHVGKRLYPFLPKYISYLILLFPYLLHRVWYLLGNQLLQHEKTTERYRRLRFAKGFEFVATVTER